MTEQVVLPKTPAITFAWVISVLLHPFVMAIAMFLYLPWRAGQTGAAYPLTALFFLFFSVLAPLLYLKWQQARGRIDDLDIRDRRKRQRYYNDFLILYALQLLLAIWLFDSSILWAYAFGYLVNTALYAFINRTWKISIHGAGVGGPTGILLFLEGGQYWPLIFLVIPLLWSRVKLRYHTPAQVISGATLGGALFYLEMLVANRLWP